MRNMGKTKIKKVVRTFLPAVFFFAAVFAVMFRIPEKEKIPEPAEETAQEVSNGPGELYAQSAVLMDADSGRVLFGKNEKTIRPMASTTKIMTCILALENAEKGEMAAVSENAARQPKVRLGVKEDESYEIEQLLYSLMLESHNDSAVVIAEALGGSVENFASMMNEKAKELGCTNTHFVTPNGLDGEDEGGVHATTATDLARILKYCITESPKKEEFLKITQTKQKTICNAEQTRSFSCTNHNQFLSMMEGALTGKTGFTADAGYCYVGALQRGEKTFIVALLACGWPGNKSYKWADTKKLMTYGLETYTYKNVWEMLPDEVKASRFIHVNGGVNTESPFLKECVIPVGIEEKEKNEIHKLRLLLRSDEEIEAEVKVKEALDAPVQKNACAGKLLLYLNGETVGDYSFVTLRKADKRTLLWCAREIFQRYFAV